MFDYRLFFPNTQLDDRHEERRAPRLGHGSTQRVYRLPVERRVERESGRR